MKRREFIRTKGALLLAGLAAGCAAPPPAAGRNRVLVLGFDGMDPVLAEKWMEEGALPNLRRLRELGGYSRLRTSTPPQSPVAWSSFATGLQPGRHGIFDFIQRDPETYAPYYAGTRTSGPHHTVSVGSWTIPLGGGRIELLRRGETFWQTLSEQGVPSTIYRMPGDFPATAAPDARVISDIGTPDLRGGYGTFSLYTDDPSPEPQDVSGGEVHRVTMQQHAVQATLVGPEDAFHRGGGALRAAFTVYADRDNEVAKVVVQGEQRLLNVGEWSSWVPVRFDPGLLGPAISGICRFYLKSLRPHFALYVSPININPADPALPIAAPAEFARDLSSECGLFYTQGLAEDTKALSSGVLSDDEFLQQSELVYQERKRAFDHLLHRFDEGVLFAYFSTSDQVVHAFWRAIDAKHPLWTPALGRKYGGLIRGIYERLDSIVGEALSALAPTDALLVLSDHGFQPFRRCFALESWLAAQGYLALDDSSSDGKQSIFEHADWGATRAYSLGLNGLYINTVGREAQGIVSEGEQRHALLTELKQKLLSVRDPVTGDRPIAAVRIADEAYQDAPPSRVPDIVVGYRRGYRVSWESVLGEASDEVFSDNLDKWSGDHCIAASEVPGVLFANRPVTLTSPGLCDVTATILSEYAAAPPEGAQGRSVFAV